MPSLKRIARLSTASFARCPHDRFSEPPESGKGMGPRNQWQEKHRIPKQGFLCVPISSLRCKRLGASEPRSPAETGESDAESEGESRNRAAEIRTLSAVGAAPSQRDQPLTCKRKGRLRDDKTEPRCVLRPVSAEWFWTEPAGASSAGFQTNIVRCARAPRGRGRRRHRGRSRADPDRCPPGRPLA